jgi:hypothetical protein
MIVGLHRKVEKLRQSEGPRTIRGQVIRCIFVIVELERAPFMLFVEDDFVVHDFILRVVQSSQVGL